MGQESPEPCPALKAVGRGGVSDGKRERGPKNRGGCPNGTGESQGERGKKGTATPKQKTRQTAGPPLLTSTPAKKKKGG